MKNNTKSFYTKIIRITSSVQGMHLHPMNDYKIHIDLLNNRKELFEGESRTYDIESEFGINRDIGQKTDI